MFSLKKRLLHEILTSVGSSVVCLTLLVFRNLLHDLHFLLFAGLFFFFTCKGSIFHRIVLYLIEATLWIFEAEQQHLNLYESINGAVGNVALLW